MSVFTLGPPLPFVTEGAFAFPRLDIPKQPADIQTPRVAPEQGSARRFDAPLPNPVQKATPAQDYWIRGKEPQGRGVDGLGTPRIGKTSAAARSQISATGVANESVKIEVPGGSISVNRNGVGASVLLGGGLTIDAGKDALGLTQKFNVGKDQTISVGISGTINGQKNTPTFTLTTENKGTGITVTLVGSDGKIEFKGSI